MTIVRVGTNSKYGSGWESIFGGKKSKSAKPAEKASAKAKGKDPSKSAKKSAGKKAVKKK